VSRDRLGGIGTHLDVDVVLRADIGQRGAHHLEVARLDALLHPGARDGQHEMLVVDTERAGFGERGQPDRFRDLLAQHART
jgi:hypothetical protein